MAKIARISSVFLVVAGLFLTMVPAAQAQTYVYPINSYGSSYVTPSYSTAGCVTLTNYLAIGSLDLFTNGQVSMLQQYLNRAGLMTGVSGSYDWNTRNAVVAFQASHGITATGTVGPITRAAINQASCGYATVPPVIAPVVVPPTIWNTGCVDSSRYYPYDTSYRSCGNSNGYNYNYGNNAAITLNSANATYNYGSATITLRGYGFTSNDTVHFDGSTYTAYSADGTTLTFTIPNGYYSGNYDIYVVNSYGASSNTLSFPMSSSNNSYNSNNGTVSLSSINGASSVQTGTTNTWNVSVSNSSYYNYNSQYTTIVTDWGDSSNTTSQSINLSGSQNVSFSHVYNNAGTYTIRLTATNSNGAYAYQTLTITVYGNNNGYNYGTPNISYISPNPATIGSSVTISGSGFSSYGNTVHFSNGGSMNVSSYNGSTIYYTIPRQVSGCDVTPSSGYCAQWLSYVTPGSYPVYVTNAAGQTSNTVYLTVR